MKNKLKLFGLLLTAGFVLAGCSGTEENSDNNANGGDNTYGNVDGGGDTKPKIKENWSDAEIETMKANLYDVVLPFYSIGDETELEFDGGSLYKTAPAVDANALAEYAKLFDDSWFDYSEAESYYYYFQKVVSTEAGDRYVAVEFYTAEYSEEDDDYLPNGQASGEFVLFAYDPFIYEWPADLVDEFGEELVYYGAITAMPTIVPFNGADFYDYDDSYWDYGMLGIYCITSDPNAESAYVNDLLAAGYVAVNRLNSKGQAYTSYVDATSAIELEVIFSAEDGVLAVYMYPCTEEVDPEEQERETIEFDGDTLTQESLGLTAGNSTYGAKSFTAESGAKYDAFVAASYGIQMRSKDSNSGVVVSNSIGTVNKIGFAWNRQTAAGKIINIYGSNEPFTIDKMYGNDTVTLVGTVKCEGDVAIFEFNAESQYAYIGFRSNSGAVYLDEVVIVWNVEENPEAQGEGEGEGEGQQQGEGEGQQGEGEGQQNQPGEGENQQPAEGEGQQPAEGENQQPAEGEGNIE